MSLLQGSDRGNELSGLSSPDEITLFIRQEEALLVLAKRREADARVRHINFDLLQRAVLLVLAVVIAIALIIGVLSNPALLKLAVVAASALGAITAGLTRWRRS